MQIATALQNLLHFRIVRLPAMPQQRQQLAIVVSDDALRSPGTRVEHRDNGRTIVVALQCLHEITLCVGTIACGPVGARPQISKQMKCSWSERIVASSPRRRLFTYGQAHAAIAVAVLRNLIPVAGRQRNAVAVVDRATGDRVRDREQTWVVFVAALSIRLQRESTGARSRVSMDHLDVKR